MGLEITGVLIQVLPETSGNGKAGVWRKRDFVIETIEDKYPKKICFTAWADKVDEIVSYPSGSEIIIFFEPTSQEYNGKWFTNLKAWKIMSSNGEKQINTTPPKGTKKTTTTTVVDEFEIGDDDLPF